MKCGGCKYFDPHPEVCRRYPPINGNWALVSEYDWCGEHRAREVKFIAPSLTEVSNYCAERKNAVDPKAFCDFYESKGWMVGKGRMKNWRAAIRTWEQRDEESKRSGKQSATQRNADLHGYLDAKIRG